MRAVELNYVDPASPASLVEVPPPELPGPAWARIAVDAGGICGSDLHMFTRDRGPAPLLSKVSPLPMLLGHEIAGRVIEAGPASGVAEGDRVAVEPTTTCEARGIDPPCPWCQAGAPSSCQRLDSRVFTPGMALGLTTGLGGGWAEQVVAHRTMMFALPDAVADRAASLHEPVSIAVHGLLRRPPADGGPIAVVGGGVIVLAAVAASRWLFPTSEVTAIARHPHQARAAKVVGAHHVVSETGDGAHMEELARIIGTHLVRSGGDHMLARGYWCVVEAVGTSSAVNQALRIADNRATVILSGAATTSSYDLTPVWFKELDLIGAANHSPDPGPRGGPTRHSVARALDILAAGRMPDDVIVTHEFALEDHRMAVATAIDRHAGAIKVVFRPNGTTASGSEVA